MSDTVIKVENLGKFYRIGKAQQRHDTFHDQLANAFTAPFQRLGSLLSRDGNRTSSIQHHV